MEVEGTFEELGLNQWILDHLQQLGFKRPSPVQYHCIPPALEGQDCFGCSKTGSGKTAAFALPVLQKLSLDPYGVFCLVLTPTRELAYQIAEQFSLLGKPINLQHTVVVGGMDTLKQAAALKKKPHVVIATPGRLADLLRSSEGNVKLNKSKFLILDEADRLLDKMDGDFSEDLDVIFQALPKERQTLLFSATLTDTLAEVREMSTKKPFFWEAQKTVSTVDQLDQRYILLPEHVKDGYLVYICMDLMEKSPTNSIMIFTKTCRNCHVLGMLLQKAGFDCVVLHSGMKQRRRLSALARFKSSNIRLLVATDVAARGLDIPLVQVVINHNIPGLAKNYIHRVGRTARAGRSGMAISLVTQFDINRVQSIEDHINTKLKEYDVNEDEVLRILTKVNVLKREAEQRTDSEKFGETKRANKRKALVMEGKDPDEEARRQRKARFARKKAERKELKNFKARGKSEIS